MESLNKETYEHIKGILDKINQDINLPDYIFQYETTNNMSTCAIYKYINGACQRINDEHKLLRKYSDKLNEYIKGIGVLVLRKIDGRELTLGYVPKYNTELSFEDLNELINFQEFNIEHVEETRKEVLKKSLRAEKIKKTLVYAAYINDTSKILERAAKASKTQLNKKLKVNGTPLGLCAINNNLEGFVAIAEAGADIGKNPLPVHL